MLSTILWWTRGAWSRSSGSSRSPGLLSRALRSILPTSPRGTPLLASPTFILPTEQSWTTQFKSSCVFGVEEWVIKGLSPSEPVYPLTERAERKLKESSKIF